MIARTDLLAGPAARAPFGAGYRAASNRPQDDVSANGQQSLMIRETSSTSAEYVEKWHAELLARSRQSSYSPAPYARM